MNKNILIVVPIFCALFITACGSDGHLSYEQPPVENEDVTCSDVVYYDDALIRVVSVIDSSNDDRLVQVTFSELTIGDRSNYNFNSLEPSVLSSVDIASDGESAICTIPCELFTFEAEYSMVVSAPAFESKVVEFEPRYESDGGPPCRSNYSGSYELFISLDPEH